MEDESLEKPHSISFSANLGRGQAVGAEEDEVAIKSEGESDVDRVGRENFLKVKPKWVASWMIPWSCAMVCSNSTGTARLSRCASYATRA
jgi:hypothetical protein